MFMACLRKLHKMDNLITYDLSTSPALFSNLALKPLAGL